MDSQKQFRQQILDYLSDAHAHAPFDQAVKGLPLSAVNKKLKGMPYSFWELLEHTRLSQNDIIEFVINPKYQDKAWPEDYWPSKKPATKAMWDKSIKSFRSDLAMLIKLVKDPKTDLLAKIPHGQGQTILREVILIIDHNAYHVGEMVVLRRMMGLWK